MKYLSISIFLFQLIIFLRASKDKSQQIGYEPQTNIEENQDSGTSSPYNSIAFTETFGTESMALLDEDQNTGKAAASKLPNLRFQQINNNLNKNGQDSNSNNGILNNNKVSAHQLLGEMMTNQTNFEQLINTSFSTARNKLKIIDKIYQKAYPRFKESIKKSQEQLEMTPVVENIFEMALKNPYNAGDLDNKLKDKFSSTKENVFKEINQAMDYSKYVNEKPQNDKNLNQQVTNIFGKFDKIINQEKEKRNDDEVLYTSGGKGIHFNPKMSQDEQEKNMGEFENVESKWRNIFKEANN